MYDKLFLMVENIHTIKGTKQVHHCKYQELYSLVHLFLGM